MPLARRLSCQPTCQVSRGYVLDTDTIGILLPKNHRHPPSAGLPSAVPNHQWRIQKYLYLSISIYIYIYLYLSIYLSICRPINLSIYLSISILNGQRRRPPVCRANQLLAHLEGNNWIHIPSHIPDHPPTVCRAKPSIAYPEGNHRIHIPSQIPDHQPAVCRANHHFDLHKSIN